MLRARETAEIINESIGVELIIDPRLREINYGDLEGIPRDTLKPEIWDIFNMTPEKLNAEPFTDVFLRIKSSLEELSEKQENTLIVTHGGPLRMIMYYASCKDSFDKEAYRVISQNAKIKNSAIFEWDKNLTCLRPIPLESGYKN
ncbi:MAG: putative phosphoserine phosphatase 2 [Syntrophomonadaceae bacterium]|nr:putative phosphoserine phosphatase 2 [Bacillota bacterium]